MDQEIFGITVLEWLKVLVVPITVSAAVPWLNWLQKKREQTVEHQRAQDEALQAYLDKMSELLSPERVTARAQTLTVLRRLDAVHKRTVPQFLREARPINRHEYSPKDEPNVTRARSEEALRRAGVRVAWWRRLFEGG